MLGSPLGDAVGRARLKLVEGAVVCLGDVSDHRRLRPVDSSGAQEEHSLYATSRREIQSVTRAIYDGAEQVQRSAARARSSENRVAEFAFRKRECAHIARMRLIGSDVRSTTSVAPAADNRWRPGTSEACARSQSSTRTRGSRLKARPSAMWVARRVRKRFAWTPTVPPSVWRASSSRTKR